MKNNPLIFVVLSFFSGVVGTLLITNFPNINYLVDDRAQVDASLIKNYKYIHERLIFVDNKIAQNNAKLDYVLEQLLNTAEVEMLSQNPAENEPGGNDLKFDDEITQAEISVIKNNIFSSLSNPSTTLSQILNSPKLNKIPQHEKYVIIEEIVRQVNNGEISIKSN